MRKGGILMKKEKIFGIVCLCISSIVTTLVTVAMTDKEIKKQVDEHFEKDETEKIESQ